MSIVEVNNLIGVPYLEVMLIPRTSSALATITTVSCSFQLLDPLHWNKDHIFCSWHEHHKYTIGVRVTVKAMHPHHFLPLHTPPILLHWGMPINRIVVTCAPTIGWVEGTQFIRIQNITLKSFIDAPVRCGTYFAPGCWQRMCNLGLVELVYS